MKTSTLVKCGIGLSALCAAALTIDNTKLARKNRQLESELEEAKASSSTPSENTGDITDDMGKYMFETYKEQMEKIRRESDAEDEFEARLESVNNRLLALAERKLEAAEAKAARKAAKAQAKAERKLAKAEAKAAKA